MFQVMSSLEYQQQQRFELDVNHCSMLLKEVPGKNILYCMHVSYIYIFQDCTYNNLILIQDDFIFCVPSVYVQRKTFFLHVPRGILRLPLPIAIWY